MDTSLVVDTVVNLVVLTIGCFVYSETVWKIWWNKEVKTIHAAGMGVAVFITTMVMILWIYPRGFGSWWAAAAFAMLFAHFAWVFLAQALIPFDRTERLLCRSAAWIWAVWLGTTVKAVVAAIT